VTAATFADFATLDIRVGRVIAAEPVPEARNPARKLRVDFGGKTGVRRSSAPITGHLLQEGETATPTASRQCFRHRDT
jgi:tRNA-binding protein